MCDAGTTRIQHMRSSLAEGSAAPSRISPPDTLTACDLYHKFVHVIQRFISLLVKGWHGANATDCSSHGRC
jgi:hypothetical protein